MLRCEKCGAQVAEGSTFCTECGTPLKNEEKSKAEKKGEKTPEETKPTPEEDKSALTQPEYIAQPQEVEEKTKAEETAPIVPPKDVPESKPSITAKEEKPAVGMEKPKKKRTGLVVLLIIIIFFVLLIITAVAGYFLGWFDEFLYAQPPGIIENFDVVETNTFQNIYVAPGGQVKIQAGEMLLANSAVQATKDVGNNYLIKVRLKFISIDHTEGWAGIIARINPQKPTYHYAFQLYPDKDLIAISKVTETGIEELASFKAQIEVNYDYLLEVAVQGKDFSFVINGQKFLDLTDITFNVGDCGLEAYYSQALFDEFIVEPLGE